MSAIAQAHAAVQSVRLARTYEEFSFDDPQLRPATIGWLRWQCETVGLRHGCARRDRDGFPPDVHRWTVNTAGECLKPLHFVMAASHEGSARHEVDDVSPRGRTIVQGETKLRLGRTRLNKANALPEGCREYIADFIRRCEKCEWCRAHRALHWAARACREFNASAVTWLVTFTIEPMRHAWMNAVVDGQNRWRGDPVAWSAERKRAARTAPLLMLRGGPEKPWSAHSERDKFPYRARAWGAEITKYLERVRIAEHRRRDDGSWPAWSYLLVAEQHKQKLAGLPHFHMLLHEEKLFELVKADEYYPLRNDAGELVEMRVKDDALVRDKWPYGHIQFKRCEDEQAARYVLKYMFKEEDLLWKVHASLGYGAEADDE